MGRHLGLGVYIYKIGDDLDPPIMIGRFGINGLGRPNMKTEIFCGCLGMFQTHRSRLLGSGPGQFPDACEGSMQCAKRGRVGLGGL